MARAEIRDYCGLPTMFVDGRPVFAGIDCCGPATPDEFPRGAEAKVYARAGVHTYAFNMGTGGERPEWCGAAEHDFSGVESSYGRILDVDADACFILRVDLELKSANPRHRPWLEEHPDECELLSDGRGPTQSFASPVWREQAKEFLRAYIAHLQEIGIAERVIGYKTGAGYTGEWVKPDSAMRSECGDYSPAMLRHFRDWLAVKYRNASEALRDAWHDHSVDFSACEVPSAELQLSAGLHALRDPALEQPVVDYYECLAELCADLVIDFNRTVKEATEGQALAGAFYGYLLELSWNAAFFGDGDDSGYTTVQRCGHLGLSKVLRSKWVDFLVSPYSYGFREAGGATPPMQPMGSLRSHGKFHIYEEDHRNHLNPPGTLFGPAKDLEQSIDFLRRNMCEVLTRGTGIWWNSNADSVNPVVEPAYEQHLRQCMRVGRFCLELDRSPVSDVAVLVDDTSFLYQSLSNTLDFPLVFDQRLNGLARMEAAVEYYMLDDLLDGRVPDARLYVFLNAFHLDRVRRDALAAQVQRDGRVALWIYAAGFLTEEAAIEQMAAVTGMAIRATSDPGPSITNITNRDHAITAGLPADTSWGTSADLSPRFHVEDREAIVLGESVDPENGTTPSFCLKELDDWSSVYSASPNLPANVLRGIARYAGAHIYGDQGDLVYRCKELFGVHAVTSGTRQFRLPRPVSLVYDLFENAEVARDTDCISVTLHEGATRLYYTGDPRSVSVSD